MLFRIFEMKITGTLLWLGAPAVTHAAQWPIYPAGTAPPSPAPSGVPASFDCAMRTFAYEHGKALLPRLGAFEPLFYALGLNEDCNGTLSGGGAAAANTPTPPTPPPPPSPPPADSVYVAPTGSDGASCGSAASPCASLQHAADKAGAGGTVVVRGGTYYLAAPVLLTSAHAFLNIQAAAGERPVVSGGVPLRVAWRPHNITAPSWDTDAATNNVQMTHCNNATIVCPGTTDDAGACQALCEADGSCTSYTWHDASCKGYERHCIYRTDGVWDPRADKGHTTGRKNAGRNVWVADVAGQVTSVPGLQLNGARATRARFPNLPAGLEASCGYGCMVPGGSAAWTPPDFGRFGPVQYFTDNRSATRRNDTDNWFNQYMIGTNGLCSVYDPPVGYWCSEHTSGGGAFAFRTPSGVAPKAGALPHAPYGDVSQAVLNVWRPQRWANWMVRARRRLRRPRPPRPPSFPR